jgi:hypothetical protein
MYGNDKSREREVKPENQIVPIRNLAARGLAWGEVAAGCGILPLGFTEQWRISGGGRPQASRYQGTLMTTMRWLPRSKRSAFRTEARLLWNRW